MEDLRGDGFTHLDTAADLSGWNKENIRDAFKGIAPLHALYYGNIDAIPDDVKKELPGIHLREDYDTSAMRSAFECLNKYIETHHGLLLNEGVSQVLKKSLDNMDSVFAILLASPTTFVHNDFNVRNICLRKHPNPDQHRLCVFDWEMARIMPPQHDIAECIAFVLPKGSSTELWEEYMEMYRQIFIKELESLGSNPELINTVRNKAEFRKVFHMCVLEFAWNRLSGYLYMSKVLAMPFLSRLAKNVYSYIVAFSKEYDFLSV